MTQAKTDMAATTQPNEVGGRGRVRIHSRTVK
jgi:hypothetical protein